MTSSTLAGGSIRILWDEDDSAEVTITGSNASFTVGGVPVTFPYTLTSSTTFATTQSGEYTISVLHYGYEIAGSPDGTRRVALRFGEEEIFAPSPDSRGAGDGFAAMVRDIVSNDVPESGTDIGGALASTFVYLVDPRRHGALIDGTTNDVLAWRAAVAEAVSLRSSGLVRAVGVLVPDGTSRIDVNGTGAEAGTDTSGSGTKFAVVIPSDISVVGHGPSCIVKMTGVPATANGNPNQNSVFGIENGTKNVEFRDFRVVGENGTSDGTGFTYLLNNQSAAIDILLTTTRDISVRNVTFENLYGFSVHDRGENKRIHVRDCVTRYCSNGINVNSNEGVFTGNVVFHSEGFECSGYGITITDNVVEEALGVGISAGGNFGNNAQRAGSIVANNTVYKSTDKGITINDAFVGGIIANNTVRCTDGIGISCTSTTGSHVNFGNIFVGNNVVSCGVSGAIAGNAVGMFIGGTGAQLVVGNRSIDGGISGFLQQYGIRVASTGTRLTGNVFNGNAKDIEGTNSAVISLDDSNTYTTLNLSGGSSLASKTTVTDATHQGVETFEHHIVAKHPASGVSNYTVAVGAAATAASRVSGTDAAGAINYTVSGGTTGALFSMTFARAYATTPQVIVQATDSRMAAAQLYVSARSTTGFTVSCGAAHSAGTSQAAFWVIGV